MLFYLVQQLLHVSITNCKLDLEHQYVLIVLLHVHDCVLSWKMSRSQLNLVERALQLEYIELIIKQLH